MKELSFIVNEWSCVMVYDDYKNESFRFVISKIIPIKLRKLIIMRIYKKILKKYSQYEIWAVNTDNQ